VLSEIQGKKQKVVAEALGLSLPALKSRILRGRKKLKDLMAKRCTFYRDESGQLVDYDASVKGGAFGIHPQIRGKARTLLIRMSRLLPCVLARWVSLMHSSCR
jgi:hypothetical protein